MQFKKAVSFILKKLENELPLHLSYHNADHVRDVYLAAEHISKQEGIADHEIKLLLTAAGFHDSGFLKGADNHEEESCRIATRTLPGFGYSQDDIEKICAMIIATKIPQDPKNHLEEILADADLDYLGRDDFFIISERLFQEFLATGIVHNEEEWYRLQTKFFENHHYFTQTVIDSRAAKKQQHLNQIKTEFKRSTYP